MATVDDALAYQQSQIGQFKANMPAYQQSQFSGIQDNALTGLKEDNAKIDQNTNARGLLYSGIKDQLKANAASNRAGQAAQQESQANYNINQADYNNVTSGINSGVSNYQGTQGAAVSSAQQSAQQQAGQNAMLGNIAMGAGMLALASDKNVKENIESGDKDLGDFLDKIPAKKYDYKDEENGKGKQYGLLAQDLEKHPVGEAMVIETPKGKAVDYGKGLATILATQSFLHKKMKDIESKGKS